MKFRYCALILVFALISCDKESGGRPILETVEAKVDSNGDLLMKGRIIDANGSEIVAAGFCIALDKEVPTMTDNQQLAVIDGNVFTQVAKYMTKIGIH